MIAAATTQLFDEDGTSSLFLTVGSVLALCLACTGLFTYSTALHAATVNQAARTTANQAWGAVSSALHLEQNMAAALEGSVKSIDTADALREAQRLQDPELAGGTLAWRIAGPVTAPVVHANVASREMCLELNKAARIRMVDDRLRCQGAPKSGYVLALTLRSPGLRLKGSA